MTLSIKNGGYAFLIRLVLMFSMSLWKEIQPLQTLNDLSIKHSIKLILYENDLKLLKFFKKSCIGQIVIWLKCEILIIDTWNEYIKKSDGMVNLFFYYEFNFKKFKKFKKLKTFNESCSFSKAATNKI